MVLFKIIIKERKKCGFPLGGQMPLEVGRGREREREHCKRGSVSSTRVELYVSVLYACVMCVCVRVFMCIHIVNS